MSDTVPKPKPDNDGVAAPPFGPKVCLIVRHDGKLVGLEKDRHDAAWTMYNYHDCNDHEIRYVPVGSVPIQDLSIPAGWKQ